MSDENVSESSQVERRLSLGSVLVIILFMVLFVAVCGALTSILFNNPQESVPTAQEELPPALAPTAALPPALPTPTYAVDLPLIQSSSIEKPAAEAEQVWKVTKIKPLGYQLGGQSYDLATFVRLDGMQSAKAYCINPGWTMPKVGDRYLLNADGIFVTIEETSGYSLQRFKLIQRT